LEKTVQKIPFLRFSLAFAAGIVVSPYFRLNTVIPAAALIVLMGVVFLLHRFYTYRTATLWGFFIHLFFISLGMLVYSIYNQPPAFYEKGSFSATVFEIPEEKPNSYQAVLKISAVYWNDSIVPTNEKMMAWLQKSSRSKQLAPGNRIVFRGSPQMVENNGNPFEFDYKGYLARKKIYRQVYIPDQNWRPIDAAANFSLTIFAEKIRLRLLRIYRRQNLGENEMQILSALTLGYKRGLDPDTRRVFASAGAMHVLAVSGLHVGIIYLMLGILLGFLRKRKSGKILFVLLVTGVLWFFAFITGLSPSVSRAATMFTFVVAGKNLRRQTNIYNTLAASAFVLLLINPNNLFEVGFQLSYCAVFGIVFLQPRFEKLVTIPYRVPRWFWQLLTVSVAAQIATFPVSVFYFNQFPVYFWISNLFVIPAVMLLIPSGIILLVFHRVPVLSELLSFLIDNVVGGVYGALSFIENLPQSVIRFSLLPAELIFLAGSLLFLFIFISSKSSRYFKMSMFMFLLLVTTTLTAKINSIFRNELIVYNQPGNTVMHLISGNRNYIVSEKEIGPEDYSATMIQEIIGRYRLDEPCFLTANTVFEDNLLCIEKGYICFKNRVFRIILGEENRTVKIIPEIIIGTSRHLSQVQLQTENQLLIHTGTYSLQNSVRRQNVYSLSENGAYSEKW
jgi:competence protein ComEC